MANINFPTSPSTNDEYTFEGKTWAWNGYGWKLLNSSAAYNKVPPTTAGLTIGSCYTATAGFTVNTGYSAGTVFWVLNDSSTAFTITQGSGLTLRLSGGTATGNRTLAAYGQCSIYCKSTTEYHITGNIS